MVSNSPISYSTTAKISLWGECKSLQPFPSSPQLQFWGSLSRSSLLSLKPAWLIFQQMQADLFWGLWPFGLSPQPHSTPSSLHPILLLACPKHNHRQELCWHCTPWAKSWCVAYQQFDIGMLVAQKGSCSKPQAGPYRPRPQMQSPRASSEVDAALPHHVQCSPSFFNTSSSHQSRLGPDWGYFNAKCLWSEPQAWRPQRALCSAVRLPLLNQRKQRWKRELI